jgi:hypothetical protein
MKTNSRTQSQPDETPTSDETMLYKPTPEEVAERAHTHFEAGGAHHGKDLEHWLTAEADLLAERNI